MPETCPCGIPSQANYYVEITIGRDICPRGTETTYVDAYFCDKHVDPDDPDALFDHPGWYLCETPKVTKLR
jgi:hypothetical protein